MKNQSIYVWKIDLVVEENYVKIERMEWGDWEAIFLLFGVQNRDALVSNGSFQEQKLHKLGWEAWGAITKIKITGIWTDMGQIMAQKHLFEHRSRKHNEILCICWQIKPINSNYWQPLNVAF